MRMKAHTQQSVIILRVMYKLMQRFLVPIKPVAIFWMALLVFGGTKADDFQGIAVVVNDDVISALDLDTRMQLLLKSLGVPDSLESRDQIRPQILQSLIDERLKIQEAERLGIAVGSSEIQTTLSDIARQNGFEGDDLEEFFRAQDIDLKTLKDQILARLIWARIVSQEITPEIEIDSEDVSEILERTKRNSGKPEYLVAEIFLSVDSSQSDDAAMATMNGLIDKIATTRNFAAIAGEFSQSASAKQGGDLGWIQEEDIDTELWQELSEMQPGEVSHPIRTLAGYHLLLLRDYRISGEEMSEKIGLKQILFSRDDQTEPEQQLTQATAIRENISGCDTIENVITGRGDAVVHELEMVALSDLPEAIHQEIEPLEVGQSSDPLQTEDGVMILVVCERLHPAHDATIRDEIRQRLLIQKVDLAAQRYISDLRRAAHIDSRTGE